MEPQNTPGAAPAAAGSAPDASAAAKSDPNVLDEAARARAAALGINVDDFRVITEGKASILFPKENQVFYNPVQEYNRDLSIMMLKLLIEDLRNTAGIEKIRVLEALSASGLRSIRYAKEVEGIEQIIANDLIEDAVKSIKRNSAFNQVPEGLIDTRQSDAKFLMYKMLDDVKGDRNNPESAIHFIDIDPYGGANEFLDGAVQLVADGGMLGITCTDLAVLCGNYAESCFAKYGSMPPKRGEYCHEMALRIVLAFTAITAARYKRVIEPLVVCYADFYVRLFVRVRSSPGGVKETASKLAHIYQCNRCPSFYIQRTGKYLKNGRSEKFNPGFGPPVDTRCPHCEGSHQFAGPFWAEPIFNQDWLDRGLAHIKELTANGTIGQIYGTHKRILGTLFSCKDELPDVPLFFFADRVANVLRTTMPRMDAIRSAIHRMGYRVSQSHTEPGALKTDAPFEVILDIFKVWHEQTKEKTGAGATSVKPNSPAEFLWKKPITHVPEEKRAGLFDIIPEACTPKKDENGERLARYLLNPTVNWGPGSRAGRKRGAESMQEALAIKRAENQGKRSKRRKTEEAASSSAAQGAVSTGADNVAEDGDSDGDSGADKMQE